MPAKRSSQPLKTKKSKKSGSFTTNDLVTQILNVAEGNLSIELPEGAAILDIPVKGAVPCFISYDARTDVKGTPISVRLNGNEVANLVYNDESGSKSTVVNLSAFLRPGPNDLQCLAVVFDAIFDASKATIIVLSEGSTIINKEYRTNQIAEGFDQHWQLDYRP
ncbi:MAG TPA: hypothetical protein VN643_18160 [Pyrinomonadaceae bacterium]|nr:hypothetical protein [Pyrinomonadaceae bacterium]